MPLFLGDTEVDMTMLGGEEAERGYLGDDLVWESSSFGEVIDGEYFEGSVTSIPDFDFAGASEGTNDFHVFTVRGYGSNCVLNSLTAGGIAGTIVVQRNDNTDVSGQMTAIVKVIGIPVDSGTITVSWSGSSANSIGIRCYRLRGFNPDQVYANSVRKNSTLTFTDTPTVEDSFAGAIAAAKDGTITANSPLVIDDEVGGSTRPWIHASYRGTSTGTQTLSFSGANTKNVACCAVWNPEQTN